MVIRRLRWRRIVPWRLVAAERDVEVAQQEARQRDVPAAPEVDDVDRLVGAVEVDRQAHVHHQGEADRHVGVAREIEVKLEGVGERPTPGLEQGE
jgi:hypothetical protein